MNPDLDFIIEEDTFSEYGQRKQEPMSFLYREPITVDMEDILSVHEDENFNNDLRGLLVASRRESIGGERMYNDNDNYSLKSSHQNSDIRLHDKFLQALKDNRHNLSGKLRFAYLTDELAIQRGIDLFVLKGLREIKNKVEQIYQKAGGDKDSLERAILLGRGNTDANAVRFDNPDYDSYTRQQTYSLWSTLYQSDGSLVISVPDLLNVIANTLTQITDLFPHDEKVEEAFQRAIDWSELGSHIKDFFRTETPADAFGSTISLSHDLGSTTEPKSLVNDPEQRGPITKVTDWIKDNPGKSLLIAAALIGGGIYIKRSLDRSPSGTREVNRSPVSRSGERRESRKSPSDKIKFAALT